MPVGQKTEVRQGPKPEDSLGFLVYKPESHFSYHYMVHIKVLVFSSKAEKRYVASREAKIFYNIEGMNHTEENGL